MADTGTDAGIDERGAARAAMVHFEGHVLDLANRELRRGGERIDLGSRYFDALALLVAQGGSLVSKDRFMDEVWRGIPVTDEALTQCIRTLRRALGDSPGAPRFIETVPKHGYRFIAVTTGGVERLAQRKPGASRLAGASTIGGGVAGLLGGLFYGLAGTASGGGTVLVLAVLGGALGVLGGAGVGGGMALGRSWRGDGIWPMLAGGAAGGMLVGALGQVLSLDGVALLTGAAPGPVTGLFEGLLLGLAAAAATVLMLSHRPRGRAAALAATIGGGAGLCIALAGGRMFGASLLALQQRMPRSGLALDQVGALFGEEGFGGATRMATSVLEAAAFVACVAAANRFFGNRPRA